MSGFLSKFSRKPKPSKAEERVTKASATYPSPPKSSFTPSTPGPSTTITSSSSNAPPAYTPVGNSTPSPHVINITTEDDQFAFLKSFDTIFLIDDSGSMAGSCWKEVRDVLGSIAPICTSHDPDGVDVYFLNHRSTSSGTPPQASGGYYNTSSVAQIQQLFQLVRPSGATPTGTRLDNILRPYIKSFSKDPDNTKPINIIVITDGSPTDDPESIIVHHAKKLDQLEAPPHQVGIQFFQVGNDPSATEALRSLDDELEQLGIRDMVDTASWNINEGKKKGLSADGILKVVLGAVVRRLDRK